MPTVAVAVENSTPNERSPTVTTVAAPTAYEASCLADLAPYLERLDDGEDVQNPVLLVHGWLSTAESTEGAEISSSPFSRDVLWTSDNTDADDIRSLQERLAALPDTSVFAFDYSSIAALWVGHTATAPALAGAIECLAELSGQDVDIIAHSMGGLALRFALGGSNGGVTEHVGQVITVATPEEGSDIANNVLTIGGAAQTAFASTSVLANVVLPAVVGICNTELESDARSGCDIPPSVRTIMAIAGDGGQALQTGSAQLQTIPEWPSDVPVHAVAGDYRIHLTVGLLPAPALEAAQSFAGFFGLGIAPLVDMIVEPGDGIVGVASATAGADSQFVAQCELDADWSTVAGTEAWGAIIDEAGGIPPFGGPCAHDSLFVNQDVVDDIVATIAASR
ncbi:esterase/lipase family protein [Microbacterium sediminicola]